MSDTHYTFDLIVGEKIRIGGVPYEYIGDGKVSGGTPPSLARHMRDEFAICLKCGGHRSGDDRVAEHDVGCPHDESPANPP